MSSHDNPQERRTKILATLGPATDTLEKMEALLLAGVNCVRVNFSHGSHEDHLKRITLVRTAARNLNRIIGILGDLQGPKIRIAKFKYSKIHLTVGDHFILDAELDSTLGTQHAVGIDYKQLPQDLST